MPSSSLLDKDICCLKVLLEVLVRLVCKHDAMVVFGFVGTLFVVCREKDMGELGEAISDLHLIHEERVALATKPHEIR